MVLETGLDYNLEVRKRCEERVGFSLVDCLEEYLDDPRIGIIDLWREYVMIERHNPGGHRAIFLFDGARRELEDNNEKQLYQKFREFIVNYITNS